MIACPVQHLVSLTRGVFVHCRQVPHLWPLCLPRELRSGHSESGLIKGTPSHKTRNGLMSLPRWANNHLSCTKPQLVVKKGIAYKQFPQRQLRNKTGSNGPLRANLGMCTHPHPPNTHPGKNQKGQLLATFVLEREINRRICRHGLVGLNPRANIHLRVKKGHTPYPCDPHHQQCTVGSQVLTGEVAEMPDEDHPKPTLKGKTIPFWTGRATLPLSRASSASTS